MSKQIFNVLIRGLILLLIAPVLLVGVVITIVFALLVGVSLTTPSPPLFRRYQHAAAPPPFRRALVESPPALIESPSVS